MGEETNRWSNPHQPRHTLAESSTMAVCNTSCTPFLPGCGRVGSRMRPSSLSSSFAGGRGVLAASCTPGQGCSRRLCGVAKLALHADLEWTCILLLVSRVQGTDKCG